ncbi:ketopantoate reductase family protein [Halobacillus sp. Nhm2S1]|uniref:ketopantoate reductase family protein n=1 Tax=Halobacillus sp. Nhm2S1 TaxID=2866716 RepID=UPI001C72D58B|nr:2-dehydropantoate 2-reductase [Halobacillus sp. Nhm2S1]MBX0356549.1 2-dehydropantoate 2-reductase [Halobacillus sp. Nhm2S1]
MKIGIIGAGSIGLLAGAYLGKNHEVHMFVKKEEQREILEAQGIICEQFTEAVPVHAHLVTQMSEGYDLWMVTIKQHAMDDFLDQALPGDAPFLFLQNGMGHLEKLSQTRLISCVGVIEHGALAKGQNVVDHRGRGNIQMAVYKKMDPIQGQALSKELHTAHFPVVFKEQYEPMLKSKLIINTVINPLTALFYQPNRSILTNPSINELARFLCEEACSVLGLSFSDEWERVKKVAEATGENHSSMMKDITENRLTEVDSISGYILKHGKCPLPYHHFVLHAIHALEYERGVRKR